jgi:tRNA threonylcarbamoyladenosine biosynthesis protein TsaB
MAIEENNRTNAGLKGNPVILAVDSSTSNCSVAMMRENEIVAEYCLSILNIHDYILAELIRRILADCETNIEQIDALAISSGPGSFTGLRIGAAIAKGICFDNQIKLLPVETLFAVAFSAKRLVNMFGAERIFVAIPSHRDLFYTQFFSPIAEPISEVELQSKEEIEGKIAKNDLVCGSSNNGFTKGIDVGDLFFPTARFVAMAGLHLFDKGQWISAENFVPEYYREFFPKLAKK